ncbi:MAG TPA: hypothetical protein VMD28_00210 [Acidimicrobiales bacterium]|nr:hypothetical protein [Acidimicrobiales bacterium]
MWIVIGIGGPVLVLAIAIAVWPVLARSYRYRHGRPDRDDRLLRKGSRQTLVVCTLCGAPFEAATTAEAIAAKNAHVLRQHAQSGSSAVPATGPPTSMDPARRTA